MISAFANVLKCKLKPTTAADVSAFTSSLSAFTANTGPVSMIVKAEGPSGRAKIHSDDPKHAMGLAQYLRTIGYNAWIEDTNGNAIDEKA